MNRKRTICLGSQSTWLVCMFAPCMCGRWDIELKRAWIRDEHPKPGTSGCMCVRRQICEVCVGVHLCITPQRICVYNMLHNQTHTLFFLDQMNQLLQNFLQHPKEAERGGETSITCIVFTFVICSAGSRLVRTCPWCWSSSPTADVWERGAGRTPGWQTAGQHPNLIPMQNRPRHVRYRSTRATKAVLFLEGAFMKSASKLMFN